MLCSFGRPGVDMRNPTSPWGLTMEAALVRPPGGIVMFVRKGLFSSFGRAAVVATVAAVAMTAIEPAMARAESAPAGKGLTAAQTAPTDVSARRRYYRGG